jgi:MYXO-CTERM domain-containing protein
MSKSVIALALVALAGSSAAHGQIVYQAETQTANRFNPGANVIALDDVFVTDAAAGNAPQLQVNLVSVGIRRLANAPAVSVSLFWAEITGTDFATWSFSAPTLIGTANLPANGTTAVTTPVTASNLAGLFTANLNKLLAPGFGGFAIGVAFTNSDTLNGWRVVNSPTVGASANGFWIDQPPPNRFVFSGNPPSDFMIRIEGVGVPTPGAAALLGLGGLLAARRRR